MTNLASELKFALENQNIDDAMRLALELGDWLISEEDYSEALNSYTLSTRLGQELGDVQRLVEALYKLSATYVQLNEPDKAIIRIKRALDIAHQVQDEVHIGRLWAILGDAHLQVEKPDETLVDYQQSVKYLEKTETWYEAGIIAGKLANLHLDHGRPDEAMLVLAQVIAFFKKADRPDLHARALGNLGTAFGELGRWKEAGQRHSLALNIAREIGDSEEEAFQLTNLGYVAEMDENYYWAVRYYRQALYLRVMARDMRASAELAYDIARLIINDREQLLQAVVLLEAANRIPNPPDGAPELLQIARERQHQFEKEGVSLTPPIDNVRAYAEQAYQGN